MSVAHELDMGGEHNLPAPVEFISPEARDWHLEEQYGHFSPEEIITSDLATNEKMRVAQLQLAASRFIAYSYDDVSAWLDCYHVVTGQKEYASKYKYDG